MARNVKFTLKMANGKTVRDIDALKASFDIESVLEYFKDGRLMKWVRDRYYDDLENKLNSVSHDDADAARKLCEIFGVEYVDRFEQAVKFFNGDGVEKDVLRAIELMHKAAKYNDKRADKFLEDESNLDSLDDWLDQLIKSDISEDTLKRITSLSEQNCATACYLLDAIKRNEEITESESKSVGDDDEEEDELSNHDIFDEENDEAFETMRKRLMRTYQMLNSFPDEEINEIFGKVLGDDIKSIPQIFSDKLVISQCGEYKRLFSKLCDDFETILMTGESVFWDEISLWYLVNKGALFMLNALSGVIKKERSLTALEKLKFESNSFQKSLSKYKDKMMKTVDFLKDKNRIIE